jgi:hypothetical protein
MARVIRRPPHTPLFDAFSGAVVGDSAVGDFVKSDRDGFVGVYILAIDQRLAGEVLAPIGGRELLHPNPVIQLTSALGRDIDEAELGVGVFEQRVQIAENGFAHDDDG